MKLHYSQTYEQGFDITALVLLPYEITLFSNDECKYNHYGEFYYLMKLHYSQTKTGQCSTAYKFYYLMKLHYSQTLQQPQTLTNMFYYLMKLHYSQTMMMMMYRELLFYYLMKLHYSQTIIETSTI